MSYLDPNKLLIPSRIATTSHHGSPGSENRLRSPSESSQRTLQVPSSPTSFAFDGETLSSQRSRSSSFRSAAETYHSRGNSDAGTAHSGFEGDHLSAEEALRPTKADDPSFEIPENPFAFSPGQLNILNSKLLAALRALGGPSGLEKGLRTDLRAGLSANEVKLSGQVSFETATSVSSKGKDEKTLPLPVLASAPEPEAKDQFLDRYRVYGDNRIPTKKPVSIWRLFWNAYNDRIIILLTGAAVISLALGIYEAVGMNGLDWVEGVAIIVAIVIVVLVTGLNDYRRDRQFSRLNARKTDRMVKAIRSGRTVLVSVHEVTVGDVLCLESGDSIPADGILISGHGITCDESSVTGESDAVRKMTARDVWENMGAGSATNEMDPFIISGAKVLEGVGTCVVTSVGVHSSHGKIMMSLQHDVEETPLQVKLGTLANWIGYIGTAAALILFTVLLIRFLATINSNPRTPAQKGSQFLDILIVAVTIIVVAVPEGLPLSVTLALSFATKRMYKDNNLVRHLRACETMGNATTICSDKTGTLTQNKMTVTAGMLGSSANFSKPSPSRDSSNIGAIEELFAGASDSLKTLVLHSAAINSTAFDGEEGGGARFVGSNTETALLRMAQDYVGIGTIAHERASANVVQIFPFDSHRKCMGTVIQMQDGTFRLLVKGAAEIMLEKATKVVAVDAAKELTCEHMDDETRTKLSQTIHTYATQSLRTIAMLYKDFEEWPPQNAGLYKGSKDDVALEDVFEDMTFLGVFGLQDPLRGGVPHAVRQCQLAGIKVRMVTGDNAATATAIATECGIKSVNGLVLEGPAFRKLSEAELDRVLPNLEVLARSSPEDKRVLVSRLRHLGETVAVTGDGTNDAPALKAADIGFSMGIAGTEVAKEASSIILMDDNFRSIVKAIMWGRSVNDAVAKFLQFQITVNITAVILAFVSAVYSPESQSVLSAVQLLWVNLIMDTFAALALATDAPTEAILDRLPVPKSAPLITVNMWKMIIGQSIYQLAVTFVLYFAGAQILGYNLDADPSDRNQDQQIQLDTIVFNTFVWMQIFNEFNNRRLDNRLNIFEGMFRNRFFLGINCIMIGGQILIIFVGDIAFQIVALNGTQWAISILCALPCLLWAVVLRSIPDKYAAAVIKAISRAFRFVFDHLISLWDHSLGPIIDLLRRGKSHLLRKTKRSGHGSTSAIERTRNTADIESGPISHSKPSSPSMHLNSPPPITLTEMD